MSTRAPADGVLTAQRQAASGSLPRRPTILTRAVSPDISQNRLRGDAPNAPR